MTRRRSREHQIAQLRAVAALEGEARRPLERIEAQLKTRSALAGDRLDRVRPGNQSAPPTSPSGPRLLQWQEQLVEQARGRVKARDGFGTLTADQAHKVLRPLNDAVTNTTAEAVAPPLDLAEGTVRGRAQAGRGRGERAARRDPQRGRASAHREGRPRHPQSRGRTEAEVESLVANIRERLLEQVRAGQRVRIV